VISFPALGKMDTEIYSGKVSNPGNTGYSLQKVTVISFPALSTVVTESYSDKFSIPEHNGHRKLQW
jgi:hypothetical protein